MVGLTNRSQDTELRPFKVQRHVYQLLVLALFLFTQCGLASADDANGEFHRYQGKHILLITDTPPTPATADLVLAFDHAVTYWTTLFGQNSLITDDWKVTAYLMRERVRFENAGLFDRSVREFQEGHQEGDFLFCKDQPSDYYRRHLLLHEGVHWFMEKALGGWGPGWWMEGIAEWQATHRWDGKTLQCGVIPRSKEELPYWGRLKWVQEDLQSEQAPSLPILFQRAKDLHRFDSTYAWSWMATIFFANHPRYQEQFTKRLRQPTDNSDSLTRDVLDWIKDDMSLVQAEFNVFASEMDYGVNPQRVILDLKQNQLDTAIVEQNDAPHFSIEATKGGCFIQPTIERKVSCCGHGDNQL